MDWDSLSCPHHCCPMGALADQAEAGLGQVGLEHSSTEHYLEEVGIAAVVVPTGFEPAGTVASDHWVQQGAGGPSVLQVEVVVVVDHNLEDIVRDYQVVEAAVFAAVVVPEVTGVRIPEVDSPAFVEDSLAVVLTRGILLAEDIQVAAVPEEYILAALVVGSPGQGRPAGNQVDLDRAHCLFETRAYLITNIHFLEQVQRNLQRHFSLVPTNLLHAKHVWVRNNSPARQNNRILLPLHEQRLTRASRGNGLRRFLGRLCNG